MKTRNYLYTALIFAALSVSCQKEQIISEDNTQNVQTENQFGPTVFTLDVSMDDSKVALDGLKVNWVAGDQIAVNGVVSKPLDSKQIKSGGSSATFEFDAVITEEDYYAVYPASAYVDGTWNVGTPGEGVRVDLPKVQTYTAGQFDPSACVLVAKGNAAGMSFSHVLTYMKLTFDKTVKSVRVQANNGQRVKGQMSVDFIGKALNNYYSNSDWLTATLDGGEGIPAGEPVIIALPAKNFSGGLNFFVVTADDQYKVLKTPAIDLRSRKGVILTKAAPLADLRTYYGPGIYSETDYRAFVSAFESAYTTDTTQQGDCSEWKGEDGEINIYEDFTVNDLPRIGVGYVSRDGFNGNNVYFTETIDGNDHTITQTASTVPMVTYLGTATEKGEIKNLTLAGNCTSVSNNGWGNAAFVIRVFRGGLIKNCINAINTTYTETDFSKTSNLYFSGFVTTNDGLIEDCENKGNMDINMKVKSSSTARALQVGGIACTNSYYGKCGDFTRCKNSGNITIKKTADSGSGPWNLLKCGIGGICGIITQGSAGTKWAGDYTYFDNCVNTGSITFWEDKSGTSNGNQLPVAVGGILGASTQYGSSNHCPIFDSDGMGYYFIIQAGLNKGTIDVCSGNINQPLADTMSGARQTYVGGLVGFAQGSNDKSKGQQPTNYPLVRGHNESTIRIGGTGGSEAAGGIIGGAGFVRFEYLYNSTTKFEVTQNPDVTSTKVGGVAALAGWVMKRCLVYGLKDIYTIKADATGLDGLTIYGQGIAGITSAGSVGAAGTWGVKGEAPLIIFESQKTGDVYHKIYAAFKKADGTELPAGPVSTDSGKDNNIFYGGGAAKSKGIIRTPGNLTIVAY